MIRSIASLAGATFWCIASLTSVVHCGSDPATMGEQSSAHTDRDAVTLTGPLHWAVGPFEQHGWPQEKRLALADDHALTKHLQAWTDLVHARIQAQTQARGAALHAPRPIVKVLASKIRNAWVHDVKACVPSRVVIADGSPLSSPGECVIAENWETLGDDELVAALNEWWTARGSPCSVARESGVLRAICRERWITAQSNFVYYSTGYLEHQNEESVVSVLTHELGHYYRAHCAEGHFNPYWYDQHEEATPERPARPADSDELERIAILRDAPTTTTPRDILRVAGQRVNRRLTLTFATVLADLLGTVRASSPSPFVCDEAERRARGAWRGSFFNGQTTVADAERDEYLAYEASLLDCAAGLTLGVTYGPNMLPAGEYSRHLKGERGETLAAAIDRANRPFEAKDRDTETWLTAVRTRNLGRYTHEQEADDFALEWATKVGLDPARVLAARADQIQLEHGKHPGSLEHNNGMSVDECLSGFRNDWRRTRADGHSETWFVPLGDLTEPHHGDCYRLFNQSRELRAHRYRAANVARPALGEWAPLRVIAQELARDAGPSLEREGAGAQPGGAIVDGP